MQVLWCCQIIGNCKALWSAKTDKQQGRTPLEVDVRLKRGLDWNNRVVNQEIMVALNVCAVGCERSGLILHTKLYL